MATTTNYGWTTPDDTSLVKDGASAIRTLGSSVDTTVKALSPGTTSGDLDYYTSSTTKARLAKGTASQVLAMNSGATAPEWVTFSSGGLTLLSTTTLSGATVTISSISQAYTSLYGVITGMTNATADGFPRMNINGSTTLHYTNAFCDGSFATSNGTNWNLTRGTTNGEFSRTDANNVIAFNIYNYTSTSTRKSYNFIGGTALTTGASTSTAFGTGFYNSNSAVTSLVLSNSGGNLSTGTLLLYGVK